LRYKKKAFDDLFGIGGGRDDNDGEIGRSSFRRLLPPILAILEVRGMGCVGEDMNACRGGIGIG